MADFDEAVGRSLGLLREEVESSAQEREREVSRLEASLAQSRAEQRALETQVESAEAAAAQTEADAAQLKSYVLQQDALIASLSGACSGAAMLLERSQVAARLTARNELLHRSKRFGSPYPMWLAPLILLAIATCIFFVKHSSRLLL